MSAAGETTQVLVAEPADVRVAETPPARLPLLTKILYGVGDVPGAIKTVTFGLFVLYFYSTVMGLPAAWVGVASATMSVWDACLDPFIGHLSDNWRSRLGRRHAFLLLGALTMGVCYWLLFSPPQSLSQPQLLAWLVVALLLYRTSTSIWGVPYAALGAELSQDYHERTSINAVRGILALIGTVSTAGLSFVLFFPDTGTGADPKLNYTGYGAMGIVFGSVMTATGLLSTWGTLRQRSYATARASRVIPRMAFVGAAVQCLRNPSFRIFFLAVWLYYLGLIVNTSLGIYFFTYYARVTESTYLSLFQTLLYVMSCLGVFFWLFLSRYVQKHRLFFVATLATATLVACAGFLVGEGNLLGTGNVVAIAIGQILAGLFTSVIWFIPSAMLADITDEDELATGERREGAFYGLYNFAQQFAGAGALLLSGVLIDWFAGLVPGEAAQSPLTVQRIGIIYSVLPATLLGFSALLILRYTLTRGRLLTIQQQLAHRNDATQDRGARA